MKILTIIVILTLAIWALACGASQHRDGDDPCGDFDLDVKKVWNAEIKLKVDIAIKQFGGEAGIGESEEIATQMDNITRDWVMLRESACRDHFKRQLITAEEYKAKVTCFDSFLQNVRMLVEALAGGDSPAVDKLLASSTELARCK